MKKQHTNPPPNNVYRIITEEYKSIVKDSAELKSPI